jgi:leucyl aminopeptidase
MNYSLESRAPEKQKSDCIIIPLFSDQLKSSDLPAEAKYVNDAEDKLIQKLIERKDFKANNSESLLLPIKEEQHKRLLLLGLGKQEELTAASLKKAIQAALTSIKTSQTEKLLISLDGVTFGKKNTAWITRFAIESINDSLYNFDEFKSKKADTITLKEIALYCGASNSKACSPTELKKAISEGTAISKGVSIAKDLGNLPGAVCTPSYLAKVAKQLAKDNTSISTTILKEKEMASLGMHSLLSVSAGSEEPARLIIMEYKGGKPSDKPHVLVGKGVTFDSGGISLKPGEAMDEMKYDMCGAASVFGTMTAITELKPKINVTAIIAAAENMPDGKATKPGDIVKTLSGQTVEILNTDAEGRLVLCDAITYAEQNFKPASIVDIATLTGACIIALGHHATGMLANNNALADELLSAGISAEDKAWRMPLWDEYQPQLDSNFADMQNIGGRPAGTITAACFLSRFAKNMKWAHLDIAGTAWVSGKNKGATGRPVPLLTQYILNKVG